MIMSKTIITSALTRVHRCFFLLSTISMEREA
uniref:Uncharacterized protein n=1 Tax=Anguilla anguilla TaxID=7936 RepID=A0A0E9W6U6_ANGAN